MRIFIIGPGGVGKSTTGKILADLLGYKFIDLDDKFCKQIEIIGPFIRNKGYEKYCFQNSTLFFEITKSLENDFVFVLSSGFLVHEGLDALTKKHEQAIKKMGTSVLLLPSRSIDESTEIVVKRQLARGFGLKEKVERKKFMERFPKYLKLGDIKIFSSGDPEAIAMQIKTKLQEHGL